MLAERFAKRTYLGWVVAVAGALGMVVVGGIGFYSNSVFLLPLQSHFSTLRTQISQGFSLITLFSGLLAPVVGLVVDRYGPRRSLLIGTAGTAVTYLLFSRMNALWQFYVIAVVQGVSIAFAGLIPYQTLIGRWFVRLRGRAMGMLMAGVGMGGLLFPWLVGNLIEARGWRSAYLFAAGLMFLAPFLLTLLIVRNEPHEVGQFPDGRSDALQVTEVEMGGNATVRQALRSRPFWLMVVILFLNSLTNGLLTLHVPAMLSGVGLSLGDAGAILGMTLGVSVLGRLGAGAVAERFSPRRLFAPLIAGMGVSALSMLWPESGLARALFVIIYGLTQGGTFTTSPLVMQSLFGMKAFGRIYGLLTVGLTLGMSAGNYVGGWLFDRQGHYGGAVLLASGVSLAAAVLVLLLRPVRWEEESIE